MNSCYLFVRKIVCELLNNVNYCRFFIVTLLFIIIIDHAHRCDVIFNMSKASFIYICVCLFVFVCVPYQLLSILLMFSFLFFATWSEFMQIYIIIYAHDLCKICMICETICTQKHEYEHLCQVKSLVVNSGYKLKLSRYSSHSFMVIRNARLLIDN